MQPSVCATLRQTGGPRSHREGGSDQHASSPCGGWHARARRPGGRGLEVISDRGAQGERERRGEGRLRERRRCVYSDLQQRAHLRAAQSGCFKSTSVDWTLSTRQVDSITVVFKKFLNFMDIWKPERFLILRTRAESSPRPTGCPE